MIVLGQLFNVHKIVVPTVSAACKMEPVHVPTLPHLQTCLLVVYQISLALTAAVVTDNVTQSLETVPLVLTPLEETPPIVVYFHPHPHLLAQNHVVVMECVTQILVNVFAPLSVTSPIQLLAVILFLFVSIMEVIVMETETATQLVILTEPVPVSLLSWV